MVKNVVLRLGRRSTLEYFSGKRFEVLLHKPAVWEMDGDPEAAARHWVFQVVPQAITVVAGGARSPRADKIANSLEWRGKLGVARGFTT